MQGLKPCPQYPRIIPLSAFVDPRLFARRRMSAQESRTEVE